MARTEADRLINAGAQIMTGAYHSAHVATLSLLAQQRRVPYVIDISAADAPTANAARSVREGQQKTQYVYRIFPGSVTFGRNAVRYMTEIFREAGVSPKRIVLMYSNDLFGKTQTDSFQAALKAASPGYEVVDVIPYPENAVDLSTEVARAAGPNRTCSLRSPVPPPRSSCSRSWRGSAPTSSASSARARPASTRRNRSSSFKDKLEYVMDCTVYANYRKPETQKIAAEYAKRSGGRHSTRAGPTPTRRSRSSRTCSSAPPPPIPTRWWPRSARRPSRAG